MIKDENGTTSVVPFLILSTAGKFNNITGALNSRISSWTTPKIYYGPENSFCLRPGGSVSFDVLVDFWASWCGPCKAEMPNVRDAYKQYHDKGFEIIGLSFDSEKELWAKAIVEWQMPWIHLSDLKYWKSVAAEVYSVNSIPDNLLINPEGIVVARGLRGEALAKKLAEVFD